jgi:saccharopine dehydrogenase-like NADP-dependent oxidoreductase
MGCTILLCSDLVLIVTGRGKLMHNTFLILGGYGNTGTLISKLLLERSSINIVIAGRDIKQAEAKASELNERYSTNRVSAIALDASDIDALKTAFKSIDLVVVASSTIRYTEQIAHAALDAKIDYLDIQLSSAYKLNILQSLEPEINRAGCCFITDGGFHPGIPAAMARYAARQFHTLQTANIGSVIRIEWNQYSFSESSLPEFAQEIRDHRPLVYTNGSWKESWSINKYFDFGGVFGKQRCVPMFLEEIRTLPGLIPSLKDTGFFVAGFNWFADYFALPFIMVMLKLLPNLSLRSMGKLLEWSLKNFSRPPFGVVLLLQATGIKDGTERQMELKLSYEDGYYLTAAPVVACLLQYLNGDRRVGLWLQANYVEPERFFQDMKEMGIKMEIGLR